MNLSEFDYELSREVIAEYPSEERTEAKLLVLQKERIFHVKFKDIVNFLQSGDIVVLNDTKVLKARILTEEGIEFLLIEKEKDDSVWYTWARPSKKVKEEKVYTLKGKYHIKVLKKLEDKILIKFLELEGNILEFLDIVGQVPLPPYIKRGVSEIDVDRYQTVYAKTSGSIAAPTAGFHFDEYLLETIKLKGINLYFITLHIGIGSFKRIDTEDIQQYKIPQEYYFIPKNVVEVLNNRGGYRRLIAVGTSVVRVLESYCLNKQTEGKTELFIYPGYKFNIIDALVTNFHLPKSPPFILVCAFVGDVKKVKDVYYTAMKEGYKFLSYGDAMLII